MTTAVEVCRKGHPRTAENTKISTYRRNGKEYTLRQCQVCAELRSERGTQAGKNATPYRAARVGDEPGNAASEPATTTATPAPASSALGSDSQPAESAHAEEPSQ